VDPGGALKVHGNFLSNYYEAEIQKHYAGKMQRDEQEAL
jgi:hypothetical protein